MKSRSRLQEDVSDAVLDGGSADGGVALEMARAEFERQLREQRQELAHTRSLLNATLESTKDGIIALDVSGKVLSLNKRLVAIMGFPAEMLQRANNSELVAYVAQQVKDPEKFIARTQEERFTPEDEAFDVVEMKDGRILERRIVPQRMDNERVGVVVNFRDVSRRKRAERELRDALAQYHSLVDQMPGGVFRKDSQGRYVFVNAAFCKITGMPADQILGRTASELVGSMKAALSRECPVTDRLGDLGESHHDLIMRTGQAIQAEDEYTDSSGKSRYYHVFKSPVFGVGGDVIGSQGIQLDVTERKRAEGELAGERALLESLLENSPDHIYFKDLQSRFIKVSRKHAEQFGFKNPDEILGRTDFDFFDKSHAEPAFAEEQEIIRTGAPLLGKIQKKKTKDGRITWALITKMPLRDNQGRIIGTFGISKDITAMKEAEARLDSERELVRSLLDNSPDHIYFKDLQSRFIKCSRRQAVIFGVGDPDELLGKSGFDYFDPEHAKAAFQDEQEIIRTGAPMVGKIEKEVFKDGKIAWALTTKLPLRDKSGRIIGTFGISKDITAMKEAEAKVEQLHRQLLEISRQAGMAEVATGVLHNVGNVLNSVNVAASLLADRLRKSKISSVGRVADMLREHELDLGEFVTRDPKGRLLPSFLAQLAAHLAAEQVSFLEELSGLEKNINHIKDIVAMQQSYARVSGVTQTIKIVDLVEDALRINDHALVRHDVKLVRDYDPSAREITVDNHKVIQILINLVRNAKYACDDSGLAEKRVVVRVLGEGDRVKISVMDNGIGISPENLTRVFNHGFTTRKDGHGFGLHSGALAAKELGGSLTVQSDGLGRGATFTLDLPLRPPAPLR